MSEGDAAVVVASDLRLAEQCGPQWFSDLSESTEARTLWVSARAQSHVHCVVLSDPAGSEQRVIIKRNRLETPADRPRLGLRSEFQRKHEFEAAALRAMRRAVTTDQRPELGAVRVLATLDDGLVMTASSGRELASTIRRGHGRHALDLVYQAGSLLAAFHALATEQENVRGTAADVAEMFEHYRTFLGDELDPVGARLDDLVDHFLADLARQPPRLGLGHGDFAPRNVLIENGRALLIDPLGSQRCPIEEDLAYFALALRQGSLVPWVAPVSSRVADRLETRLLDGYGRHGIVPFRYEMFSTLVILDAIAADRVRDERPESLARRAIRATLPPLVDLLADRLDRADRCSPKVVGP